MLRLAKIAAASFSSLLFLAALAPVSDAAAVGADPAARGVDLFIDMPPSAAPGTKLPLQIQAFGFPTATALSALKGASIEAVWDPESLGPGVSAAPPKVVTTTGESGRVRMEVPVPEGDERRLLLLLGVSFGEHRRTIEVSVTRKAPRNLTLIVPDRRVVPGGATTAWVLVRNSGTGQPAVGEAVRFELLEGGVPRFSFLTKSDAAGTAVARVPIPWTDEPDFSWTLAARTESAANEVTGTTDILLAPREETPGEAQLTAEWSAERAMPGDHLTFVLRLRDASDKPVAGGSLRYWIGPKGTEPPSPKDDPEGWERVSTLARTDASGEVRGSADAPTTLRKGATSSMQLVAHAELFGHELDASKRVTVAIPSPTVQAVPEAGWIIPGVTQSVIVSVRDPRDKPVAGSFLVEGDGLSQKVTTNDNGEAEVTWKVPLDVGANRNVGPCAGGIAATVTVRPSQALAALNNRTDPFATCVDVNRQVSGLLRTEKPMVSAGSAVRVRLTSATENSKKPENKGSKGSLAWSVSATPPRHASSVSAGAWLEDPSEPLDLGLSSVTPGTWQLGGLLPLTSQDARVATGRILVRPAVLPKVEAKITGGRAAPLGTVEIDVDLTDSGGRGLPGSVAAVLIDAYGGGDIEGLERLDTRRALCRTLFVDREECDPFFDDASADVLRKRVLGSQSFDVISPARDPGGTAKEELRTQFKRVLLSLEGAVMDATNSPDSLQDALRRDKRKNDFNPELLSLATAAMDPPPVTPGGEPITLADLVAVDRQVTYDNVARRVTRLKLFRVLEAVRTFRRERSLDPDEPALRDPNAILRRLVTTGAINAQDLVDPWGGTMAFVKGSGQTLPFVTARGFELRSPGPDGKIGTGDDVKSPFERVVKSGTPYADSMEEDRLVDAILDMEVSEATVDSWRTTLEELTGITLGNGLSLSGIGSGGGGRGFGSGRGRLGMTRVQRRSVGISTGAAFWLPPQRTDDKGHLHIRVPLGDVETTWRLAVVGAPDGATPAVTSVDIPSALPLSVRVDAGSEWTVGDEGDVLVTVRNRTASKATVALSIAATGSAELASSGSNSRSVEVAAGGAVPIPIRVRAKATGTATVEVVANGPGGLTDHNTHSWRVRPAGELVDMTATQWITGSAHLELTQIGRDLKPIGTGTLILERGSASALKAAVSSLDPDTIASQEGLSYAMEAAARVEKWATARGGDRDSTAVRAKDLVSRSIGRLLARKDKATKEQNWTAQRRAIRWAPPDLVSLVAKVDDCPADTEASLSESLTAIEAEPSAADGVIEACWDSLATHTVNEVTKSKDPVALARALLAFAERPHRAAMAASLADKLRAWVALRPSGGVTLPAPSSANRASRSIVFSALLRASGLGKPAAAGPEKLTAWLVVQRDEKGGYGSPFATLAAVRALSNAPSEAPANTRVTVVMGEVRKEVTVGPDGVVEVPLGASITGVDLAAEGPGVLARLVRPGVRAWSSPPDTSASPIALDIEWPESAKSHQKAVLRVSASSRSGRALTADIRIPLPPGAMLAEKTKGAHQINGQLILRAPVDATGTETLLELPIRFGLAGRFTVPEARARVAYEESARTIAPARPLIIK